MAKSALSSLLPLLILAFVIIVGAAIGFVVYSIANDIADKTSKKMEKHNVSFSKDGMKVGVKGRSMEQIEDNTQTMLMKVWNNASWPAYRSRLGWGQSAPRSPAPSPSLEKRNPLSKTPSSTPSQEKRNPFTRTASGSTQTQEKRNSYNKTTSAQSTGRA